MLLWIFPEDVLYRVLCFTSGGNVRKVTDFSFHQLPHMALLNGSQPLVCFILLAAKITIGGTWAHVVHPQQLYVI